MDPFYPPLGFTFAVQILGNSSIATSLAAAFQEVSGLNAEMKTENIVEGGENRYSHKVPSRINNDGTLVLKRGLIVASSDFGDWCRDHFSQGLNAVSKTDCDKMFLMIALTIIDHKNEIL